MLFRSPPAVGGVGPSAAVGGGGRGDLLRSAIRKSVKVSWAFVGTPFSAVLYPKTEKNTKQVGAKNIHLLRSKYSRQSGT